MKPEIKPWASTTRKPAGVIEHVCLCGVGHPSFGSVDLLDRVSPGGNWDKHACCIRGCCQKPGWKLADAQDSAARANEFVLTKMREARDVIETLQRRLNKKGKTK